MLEHTKIMLENWYITDFFANGSWICVLVALVSSFIVLFRVNKGIQSEDEKLIRNCEFLAYYSLIGYWILPLASRYNLSCASVPTICITSDEMSLTYNTGKQKI